MAVWLLHCTNHSALLPPALSTRALQNNEGFSPLSLRCMEATLLWWRHC